MSNCLHILRTNCLAHKAAQGAGGLRGGRGLGELSAFLVKKESKNGKEREDENVVLVDEGRTYEL